MKAMTCRQLGGACELEFHANSFEELADQSKKHAMDMMQKGDKAHMEAMKQMSELMSSPEMMRTWFEGKRKEFEMLP